MPLSPGLLTRVVAVAFCANSVFFLLTLLTPADEQVINQRIRSAFETGELGTTDYLWWDSRRGWHQYSDCAALQILSNPNRSALQEALAPTTYRDGDAQCPLLYALAMARVERATLPRFQYARYWHGYRLPVGMALRTMEVARLRKMFAAAVWLAIAMLALVAFRAGPHARLAGLTIAAVAASLWALPYFAQGLTQAPGDATMILMLAGVVMRRRVTTTLKGVATYAAAFGAIVAFVELLTAQFAIAAAWLVALTLAVGRDEKLPHEGGPSPSIAALTALLAFALAAAMTLLAKQTLASTLSEPAAASQFASQLQYYTRVPDNEAGWPGWLEPFGRLVQKSNMLTYGNQSAGYVLVALTGLIWLAAAVRGWRFRLGDDRGDVVLLLCAALIPVAWVLILPNHTYIHAAFMVRLLVVPIAIGPVALFWPRTLPTSAKERAIGPAAAPSDQRFTATTEYL